MASGEPLKVTWRRSWLEGSHGTNRAARERRGEGGWGRKWGKEREREERGRKRKDFARIILFEPFSFTPIHWPNEVQSAWGHCFSFWPRRTQEKMIL